MMWKIAAGSVRRHGKRSALIAMAVAVSVATMVFMSGMLEGMREEFFFTMVSSSGHLTLDAAASADALDPLSLELLLSDWDGYAAWLGEQPEALRVEPVFSFGALVVNERKNIGLVGYGVPTDTAFFRDVRSGVRSGRFLAQSGEVMMSEDTLELLDLAPTDPVLVLTEDATGAPYYLEYAIAGVYRSDSAEFDEGAFLIGLQDAQELVYVDRDIREIRVILQDPAQAEAVAARFRSTYADNDEIRIQTWRERNRGLVVLIELMDVFMYAINVLIVIVAATVITNAILMNTFEKAREQGMMRAIGLTRRGQFKLIMAEGLVYGVLGSLAGLAIGIPLVLYFQTHGIDFGEVSESFGLGRELTFRFVPITAVINAVFGTSVALAGSLYAAIVATRSTILASLRGSH